LFKRCEVDAWIAGRVMCEDRQRVAIGLRDILSRDSAIRPGGSFTAPARSWQVTERLLTAKSVWHPGRVTLGLSRARRHDRTGRLAVGSKLS
jgi:hypothetical protein